MEDRREHPRTTVIKNATLFYKHGTCSIPCILLDQSEMGAKIRIDDLFECPPVDEFQYLHITDKPRACHCIWINENELGFEYSDNAECFVNLEEDVCHA